MQPLKYLLSKLERILETANFNLNEGQILSWYLGFKVYSPVGSNAYWMQVLIPTTYSVFRKATAD